MMNLACKLSKSKQYQTYIIYFEIFHFNVKSSSKKSEEPKKNLVKARRVNCTPNLLDNVKERMLKWKLIFYFSVMQTAWRERHPAARIKAAHEALAINSDCTPALILLADEEAFTIVEAEKILRTALKSAEANYRRSQQTQHQGLLMESIHSKSVSHSSHIANLVLSIFCIQPSIAKRSGAKV